jgi:hypothetical protein
MKGKNNKVVTQDFKCFIKIPGIFPLYSIATHIKRKDY